MQTDAVPKTEAAPAAHTAPRADAAPTAADAPPASAPAPKKKKGLLVGLIAAVVVGVVAALVLPGLLVKPENYLAKGDYAKAYEIANDEQRADIVIENRLAFVCQELFDQLDPSSLSLVKVYYDPTSQAYAMQLILTYGNNHSEEGYYLCAVEEGRENLLFLGGGSSLNEEILYRWDSYEEQLQKSLNNSARLVIAYLFDDESLRLSDAMVENMNRLIDSDLLDDVEWLIVPDENAAQENKAA